MRPGDALTVEQAYRLPAGSVVRDRTGALWTVFAVAWRGTRRRWGPPEATGGIYSTHALWRYHAPLTLVSRPSVAAAASSEPPGDGG